MLVFVDESGDTGTSGKEGQSKYFVVTLVRFDVASISVLSLEETPKQSGTVSERLKACSNRRLFSTTVS